MFRFVTPATQVLAAVYILGKVTWYADVKPLSGMREVIIRSRLNIIGRDFAERLLKPWISLPAGERLGMETGACATVEVPEAFGFPGVTLVTGVRLLPQARRYTGKQGIPLSPTR